MANNGIIEAFLIGWPHKVLSGNKIYITDKQIIHHLKILEN